MYANFLKNILQEIN